MFIFVVSHGVGSSPRISYIPCAPAHGRGPRGRDEACPLADHSYVIM